MLALNIIFALLLSTFLYSALNVEVEVPVTRGVSYAVKGNYLFVSVPVSVRNRGLYPVENIHIESIIENNSKIIWRDEFFIKEIDPLQTYTKNFVLRINLTEVYEQLGPKFALNGGELTLKILIHANYWIFAEVRALNLRKIWWNPLISVFDVNTTGIKVEDNQIVVPYLLKTRVPLSGKMYLVINDSQGTIAKGSSNLICGKVAFVRLNLLRNLNMFDSGKWNITAIAEVGTLKIIRQWYYNFTFQNVLG